MKYIESTEIREKERKIKNNTKQIKEKNCPCTVYQLLAIIIPFAFLGLFIIIYIPIYIFKINKNSNSNSDNNYNNENEKEEYDEFTSYVANTTYATLTPKNGYDNIYIHLGGITEFAGYFFPFFKSNLTFIPKRTKIYYLSGESRVTQYMVEKFIIFPVPSWFNVDSDGNLICKNCNDKFDEAKKSLNFILDKIDEISANEKIPYNKIYLGGFSQGAIMTNYVLLNSRHKLGGYLAFSGYVFDSNFPPNSVVTELNEEQKAILDSKKDYHILATHSFNDDSVFYEKSIVSYYTYYKHFTDFHLFSFGEIKHEFNNQTSHPFVRKWLKESMGK